MLGALGSAIGPCPAPSGVGGPDRDRTDDLLDANQALSQLSYGPMSGRPNTLVKDCTSVFKNRIEIRLEALTYRHPLILCALTREGVTLLRKEVIQPQVLLQLPCYDFTPITKFTIESWPLAVTSPSSSAPGFRDVTGGVYKARERIHRIVLIHDY